MAELTDGDNMNAIRNQLALSLDIDDLDAAVALAKRLQPWFGVAKVGMELHAAAGPAAIDVMHELGFAVFLDLKLHDIPTTVGRACRVHARHGVEYLNVHASGGRAMLEAAVAGAHEGAQESGVTPLRLLAVTVLTSDPDASAFDARLELAVDTGCNGVVCSAHEITRVHAVAPSFITMVPGVRLPGSDLNDQARSATPAEAIKLGADLLVIGRTVTHAPSPEAAAEQVHRTIAQSRL
jgi:orotidine-5'-phosphate decarboxylase